MRATKASTSNYGAHSSHHFKLPRIFDRQIRYFIRVTIARRIAEVGLDRSSTLHRSQGRCDNSLPRSTRAQTCGSSYRSTLLNNLGLSLKARFNQSRRPNNLGDVTHREVLTELTPPGHPRHSSMLSSLALALQVRFNQSQRPDDIKDAINLHRAAIEPRPVGCPPSRRSILFSHPAFAFKARFDHSGRLDDLADAITLYREALELTAVGHPDRHCWAPEDLADAVTLYLAAFELIPTDHHDIFLDSFVSEI